MHYEQNSPQARANLAAIDSKLTELDHLFVRFCSEHDYKFSRNLQIWPKSRVWRRQEIDRCMDLVMDIGFQQALDVGFFPEMPWSLYAQGSLHPGTDPEVHLLSRPVFEHVPFSRLASVLEAGLTSGLQILSSMTEGEVLSHGQTRREIQTRGQAEYEAYVRAQESARKTAEPGASPNGGPAGSLGNSGVSGGPPSVS
jgi:hypothetical protein